MLIEKVEYGADRLIAGKVVTKENLPLAADTYYYGMPLVIDTGVYKYSATVVEAIYYGPTRTLANTGVGSAIIGGEVDSRGFVDDAGDPLTVTEAMRVAARAVGIFIKIKGA